MVINMRYKDENNAFGKNLKRLIKEKGISQRELAVYSDIEPCSITYYCQGKRVPTIKNIKKLAIALNVDFEELTNGKSADDIMHESLATMLEEMLDKKFLNSHYSGVIKRTIFALRNMEDEDADIS